MSKRCLNCDKILVKIYKTIGHANLYCSLPCFWNYRKEHPEIFIKNYMQKKCIYCKKEFITRRGNNKTNLYCSMDCFYNYRRIHPEVYNKTNCECKRCHKKFYRKPGYLKRYGIDGLYCSMKCRKGKPFYCLICKKQFYRKPSQIAQGAGKFCSNTCKFIFQRRGIKIKGETYEDRHLFRQSSQYKNYRYAAKKLKGNKCEKCGVKDKSICKCCGNIIYLHVHHIKSFAIYPELRFDPTNSSVLCPKCHRCLEINMGRIAGKSQEDNQQPSSQEKVQRSELE